MTVHVWKACSFDSNQASLFTQGSVVICLALGPDSLLLRATDAATGPDQVKMFCFRRIKLIRLVAK